MARTLKSKKALSELYVDDEIASQHWDNTAIGAIDKEYYYICDRGVLSVEEGHARFEISRDGRVLIVPNVVDKFFVKTRDGKQVLNKELGGYEITLNGDLVVVPNDPIMRDAQLLHW
jgi:hypothetical protein